MISHDDVFKIGRIGKIHGVKGEVTFHFTDDVFDRTDADYLFLEVDGILVPFFFEEYRFRNDDTALVKFEGIDSAEKATELTGCDVFFARELVADNDGELSWNEIVGFPSPMPRRGRTWARSCRRPEHHQHPVRSGHPEGDQSARSRHR